MTRKILSALLAVMLVVSCAVITAGAADEQVYYVEAGAAGTGTSDDPFGTIEEAIYALAGSDGTIYVYGSYEMSTFKCDPWEGMVTISGVNADSVLTLAESMGPTFNGDITFKDINFSIGKNAHFNPQGTLMVMDGGEDSNFGSFMHLSMYGSTVVDEAEFVINSGRLATAFLGGGYCNSYANGVMGDTNFTVNGGTVSKLELSADRYMDTHTGISVGGNMNIIYNGGVIEGISYNEQTVPEIMGALNIIFNNGMEAPENFSYPETAAGGVFIIKSAAGGMITPVENTVGAFNVKADEGKVAMINGEQVFDGVVELEAGETEVTWVDGEQPATEPDPIEIKLTIGQAEIITNGESTALDVPAQIIDSRTMVPLRAIFEALGASVEWDDSTKTVTSERGDTKVSLTIGEAEIIVNGEAKALDVPGQIVDSRTLVPVRAIAESFGCEVGWDDPTKTVTING